MKMCNKCKILKDFDCFNKQSSTKDGLTTYCKSCIRNYSIIYRKDNIKKLKYNANRYYIENRENIMYRVGKYQKTDVGKEIHNKSNKKYRNTNKGKEIINKWVSSDHGKNLINNNKKKQYKKNKISHCMSGNIRKSLNGHKHHKHWETLVDYNLQELKDHLKSKFQEGMTWDNYGLFGWHIDHIKPISSFNITSYDDNDFKECWSLSNLQPLWAEDNLSKGATYEDKVEGNQDYDT